MEEWIPMEPRSGADQDSSLRKIVMEGFRHPELRRTLRQDLDDLYRFYLDDPSREKLAKMGRIKRAFLLVGWSFKSLLLKLSPARRIILVAAVILWLLRSWSLIQTNDTSVVIDFRLVSFLLLLLVLMLELKDKLLARDEIRIARQVQLALLPRKDPEIPGWSLWSYMRPANDVGGDLVDYIELGPHRMGVALGDVAGKGLGAALLMSKLQATLRALAPDAPRLDDLARHLNTILHRDGLDNRFATLFYFEIAPDSSRLRYLNAGHNPAYVLRTDGPGRKGPETLPASSLPLGMLAGTEYEEGNLDLAPGELVLVYSDGLTDACNAEAEEFGSKRLEDLLPELRGLPAPEAGARIIDEVTRFLGDERPVDDMSLVLLLRR